MNDALLQYSLIAGIAVMLVLNIWEFKRTMLKSRSRWRYYLAGLFFLMVNLVIYLTLTSALLGERLDKLVIGDHSVTSEAAKVLIPIVVAFIYFGAGAGTFRIGSMEVQFNKRLLEALQGAFNTRLITRDQLQEVESEEEEFYQGLKKLADDKRYKAQDEHLNTLEDKWKEYSDDENWLNGEIDYLNTLKDKLKIVKDRLNVSPDAVEELVKLVNNIQARINTNRRDLVQRLQRYLIAFGFENYRDEVDLEKWLIKIQALRGSISAPEGSVLTRALMFGLAFGLLFGPIIAFKADADPMIYMWVGALGLMTFSGFIAQGVLSTDITKVLAWGALGGYVGHFVFNIAGKIGELITALKSGPDYSSLGEFLMEPVVGVFFGIVTVVLLHIFKNKLATRINNPISCSILIAISGAIFYSLVFLLININKEFNWYTVGKVAVIGMVVTTTMNFITEAFRPGLHEHANRPQSTLKRAEVSR